jgi:hypothetical protein
VGSMGRLRGEPWQPSVGARELGQPELELPGFLVAVHGVGSSRVSGSRRRGSGKIAATRGGVGHQGDKQDGGAKRKSRRRIYGTQPRSEAFLAIRNVFGKAIGLIFRCCVSTVLRGLIPLHGYVEPKLQIPN